MKLRLRLAGREAQRVEVPDDCTVDQLRSVARNALLLHPATDIVLTLNKKDPLGPSGSALLRDSGVASGDTVWVVGEVAEGPALPTPSPPMSGPAQSHPPAQAARPGQALEELVRGKVHHAVQSIFGADRATPEDVFASVMFAALTDIGFAPRHRAPDAGEVRLAPGMYNIAVAIEVHEARGDVAEPIPMEAVVRVLFAGSHAVVVGFVHAGGSRSHAQDTMVRWECDASGHVGGAFEGRVMSRRASGAEVGGSGGAHANHAHPLVDAARTWREVKEAIAIPLLRSAYSIAGRDAPLGWALLPVEMKLEVLKSLDFKDLCSVACTCWELRHLADSAEFWQPLYQRFFADVGGVVDPAQVGWKAAFRMEVRLQREREQARQERERASAFRALGPQPVPWGPAVPGIPGAPQFPVGPPPSSAIIGGDYDRIPGGLPVAPQPYPAPFPGPVFPGGGPHGPGTAIPPGLDGLAMPGGIRPPGWFPHMGGDPGGEAGLYPDQPPGLRGRGRGDPLRELGFRRPGPGGMGGPGGFGPGGFGPGGFM